MTITLSRMLDFGWFIWFIVGAVWTFKMAKHPCVCNSHITQQNTNTQTHKQTMLILYFSSFYVSKQHYEIPFVYHVSMTIVIFGFTVLALGLLACCVVCVLLALGLGAMLRLRRLEQGAGGAADGDDAGAGAATDAQIAALPCRTFHEGLIAAPEATCSICFGDYIPGEEVRFLPCHHHFHAACVDTWLSGSNVCPICKHPVGEPAPATAYNPAPDADSTPAAASAAVLSGVDDGVDDGAAAVTTTTTTTSGTTGTDALEQEGAPFARAASTGPASNMGTFVDIPK